MGKASDSTSNLIRGAVRSGSLERLQSVEEGAKSEEPIEWPADISDYAVQSGSLELVEWMVENQPELFDVVVAMSRAVELGRLEMMQFLITAGAELDSSLPEMAARFGHLSALKILLAEGCRFPNEMFAAAMVARGCVSTMRWLAELGMSSMTDPVSVSWAIMAGHVEAVQYLLQERGCEMSPDYWCTAAHNARVEVLEWLYKHTDRSMMSELTSDVYRVRRNWTHDPEDVLATIRWLHEVAEIPWKPMSIAKQATTWCYVPMLQYLLQQGVAFTAEQYSKLLLTPGVAGEENEYAALHQVRFMTWLREQGASWPDPQQHLRWTWPAMQWATRQGCELFTTLPSTARDETTLQQVQEEARPSPDECMLREKESEKETDSMHLTARCP